MTKCYTPRYPIVSVTGIYKTKLSGIFSLFSLLTICLGSEERKQSRKRKRFD